MAVDTRRVRAPVPGRPPQTYSLSTLRRPGAPACGSRQRRRRGQIRCRSRLDVRDVGYLLVRSIFPLYNTPLIYIKGGVS